MIKLITSRCTQLKSGGWATDAILSNNILPKISEEFLLRMMEEEPIERVHVNVTDGEFGYAFEKQWNTLETSRVDET